MILTKINEITLGEAGVYGLLGYGMVFLGLVLLMFLVMILGKAFMVAEKKAAKKTVVEETPAEEVKPVAPGAAGQLSLNNVDPKTAAMLMAIVADKLQKPINELRFISVKEVE